MEMQCHVCKDNILAYYLSDVGGGVMVCDACEDAFYRRQCDRFGEAYIAETETRYLRDERTPADSVELYYNWWLTGLEKADRLRILKAAYQAEKASNGMAYYPEWEQDFCLDADDWKSFVRSKMEEL